MKLDITIHNGDTDKPVAILIHGLGMDRNFWIDPLETKVIAKKLPMKILAATYPRPRPLLEKRQKLTVGTIPGRVNNVWYALRDKGFNLLCWSQRRPVGPIDVAVEELDFILHQTRSLFPGKAIALIGHSRGGLIARKLMENKVSGIKALITLSTPHNGSSLSRLGKYISPLSPFLKGLLPKNTHGTIAEVIKNFNDLLEGIALKELLPGSDFFKTLKDTPLKGVQYISFGGRKTKLLTVYKWSRQDDKMCAVPLLIVPDSLIKYLPAQVVPDEIKNGKGDFLVTAESARMPWAESHYTLPVNHISITWNRKVIDRVIGVLDGI